LERAQESVARLNYYVDNQCDNRGVSHFTGQAQILIPGENPLHVLDRSRFKK
jgi:hypothetical protein